MKLKILAWNVRGLNREEKRNLVRSRIQQEGADIIVLVETILKGTVGSYIQQLGGKRWMGGVWMVALGTNGGIIIMWEGFGGGRK